MIPASVHPIPVSFFTVAGTEVAPAGLYFKMLVVHRGVGLPLSASNA